MRRVTRKDFRAREELAWSKQSETRLRQAAWGCSTQQALGTSSKIIGVPKSALFVEWLPSTWVPRKFLQTLSIFPSVTSLWQIPEVDEPEEEKLPIGSQYQCSQSTASWLCCFGPVMRKSISHAKLTTWQSHRAGWRSQDHPMTCLQWPHFLAPDLTSQSVCHLPVAPTHRLVTKLLAYGL